MALSDLEQHIFAYYVANSAQALEMAPRYWPYGELVLIVEDKMQMATRKFGYKATMACPNVARAFLDIMIEKQGFSTAKDSLSVMHQYQSEKFHACLKDLQQTNAIIAKAQGPTFWEDAFAALTKSP